MANRSRRSRAGTSGRGGRRRVRSRSRLGSSTRSLAGPLLPLLLILALLALGWLGTPEHRRPRLPLAGGLKQTVARALHRTPEPVEPLWIDPADLAEATPEDWGWPRSTDERWAEEIGAVLASTPQIPVAPSEVTLPAPLAQRQADLLATLEERLANLSFVADVAVLAVDGERGLALGLELRRPVACVPVGNGFLTVDADGVLLSGTWPTPVRIEGLPLPVIGPMSDARGLFALGRPGDWLTEPEHLDALDVALSLEAHLDARARRTLGRFVIDARAARSTSVAEPGVRLLLEQRRLVLFGRRPSSPEPGELAVARKWDSLRRALEPLADPTDPFDWDVVDVRWDQPAFVARGPVLAQLASGGARPR